MGHVSISGGAPCGAPPSGDLLSAVTPVSAVLPGVDGCPRKPRLDEEGDERDRRHQREGDGGPGRRERADSRIRTGEVPRHEHGRGAETADQRGVERDVPAEVEVHPSGEESDAGHHAHHAVRVGKALEPNH